jgi:hypothetical protein
MCQPIARREKNLEKMEDSTRERARRRVKLEIVVDSEVPLEESTCRIIELDLRTPA